MIAMLSDAKLPVGVQIETLEGLMKPQCRSRMLKTPPPLRHPSHQDQGPRNVSAWGPWARVGKDQDHGHSQTATLANAKVGANAKMEVLKGLN